MNIFKGFCMQQDEQFIKIQGIIKNIIYHSEETNFTVAKLEDEDEELVTIAGIILEIKVNDRVTVTGKWVHHAKYGLQLQIEHYDILLPTNEDKIIQYLSSRIIRGIGPALAERIVDQFGEQTFNILDNDINKLLEVPGIGESKLEIIQESWQQKRAQHEALLFMSEHGIQGKRASAICKYYGSKVISILKNHPYRLAIDIEGIGFITADAIAQKIGIQPTDPERIQAALIHMLSEAQGEGHCFLPEKELVQVVVTMLKIDTELVQENLQQLIESKKVIATDDEEKPIYQRIMYQYENKVAEMIQKFLKKNHLKKQDISKQLQLIEKKMNITLEKEQKEAITKSLSSRFSIITGGPGVGKTTIIKALVDILKKDTKSIALAAPTGRAAKRLSEATGEQATTIHRLLGYNPFTNEFEYNQYAPLDVEHIIIDEVSMVDIQIAYHLFAAIPSSASITIVGDADQLPSVGPGNFLSDLIACNQIPITKLNKIHRQSKGSSIVEVAHQINQGMIPTITNDPDSDIFFLVQKDTTEGAKTIVELVQSRLPQKYSFHSSKDIQVLSPMYRGNIGIDSLNSLLADALNPDAKKINNKFSVGDKVMQIVNNYEKNVYNGDLGFIYNYNRITHTISIQFESDLIEYEENELNENIVRAYAISIHKSQGSEYPCVIIPLYTEHFMMLERNLLYTAITRGKKIVVLIGTWHALQLAVKQIKSKKRYTKLVARLQNNA